MGRGAKGERMKESEKRRSGDNKKNTDGLRERKGLLNA